MSIALIPQSKVGIAHLDRVEGNNETHHVVQHVKAVCHQRQRADSVA